MAPPALMVQDWLNEYIHAPSANYRIALALRSISAQGKITGDAFTYSERMWICCLLGAGNPAKRQFRHPITERRVTLPLYDEGRFKEVFDIFGSTRADDEVVTQVRAAHGNPRDSA